MTREFLEITASGGIYCVLPEKLKRVYDCARPNGYAIRDLLGDIRMAEPAQSGFTTDGDILRWALTRICDSSTGRVLAHDARFDDWTICIDISDQDKPAADRTILDKDAKHIALPRFCDSVAMFARSHEAQMKFLFRFLKALRLVWQENMVSPCSHDLSPADYILEARLSQADADLISVLCAYQLREAGDHGLWRYVLSSDLHPLAVTLCECLEFDASADGILDALGFVFQDWFLDETRLEKIDHQSLDDLDRIVDTALGQDKIVFEDILRLSTMPDGFSYLEYAASDILTDEFYGRIPDPVNRAHFRQIFDDTKIEPWAALEFRDAELARRIFPTSTFETIV